MSESLIDRLERELHTQEAVCQNAKRTVTLLAQVRAADEQENFRRLEHAQEHCKQANSELDAI